MRTTLLFEKGKPSVSNAISMGEDRGCLPERCRAPQGGWTPLYQAARGGHAAVVEQLLAAGAAKDAEDRVRRKGVGALGMQDRAGSRCQTLILVPSA